MYSRNRELYQYIVDNYITGKVSRKDICKKFNIKELTLRSFLYYHKLTIDPDKRRKVNRDA